MLDFSCQHRFVIQKHEADRAGLHHDLRIEVRNKDGECVLKSWATKSLEKLLAGKSEKVLLVPQIDHPLQWLHFKGEIAQGYGRGVVSIFDSGIFEVISQSDKVVTLKFNGKHLKGIYSIVFVDTDYNLLVKTKSIKKEDVTAVNTTTTVIPTPYNSPGRNPMRINRRKFRTVLLDKPESED